MLKELNVHQLKNKIGNLIGDDKMPYCNILKVKSFQDITILNNNTQSECVSGIMSGTMPTYWAFIDGDNILGAWSKYWSKEEVKKYRDIDVPEYNRNDWEFWCDGDSPFSPYLNDESTYSNEKGDMFDGSDSVDGYMDKNFDFSNSILYIEYKCQNDEICGEIYILSEEPKKLYIVFQNVGAGRLWFVEAEENGNWTYQELGGNHSNVLDEFYSLEEAQSYIDGIIKESTKYVIFTSRNDNGTDGYWIEKMDANSGTYEEVGGSHSNWLKEYETEEDAQKHLEEIIK